MAISDELKFRLLEPDEILVRVNEVREDRNKVSLLLYADSRAVMNILDITVGPANWQRKHYEVKGRNYCSIGIHFNDGWVWKDDCGSESNIEQEKGEASDAFKRAAVNWGIARELYTAPKIEVDCELVHNQRTGRPAPRYGISWVISRIEYNEQARCITSLDIVEYRYGTPRGLVFSMDKPVRPSPQPAQADPVGPPPPVDDIIPDARNTGSTGQKKGAEKGTFPRLGQLPPAQKQAGQKGKPGKPVNKYGAVKDLIKGSQLTLADVEFFIESKWGERIKINDLTNEQYAVLMESLQKYLKQNP